MSARDFITNNVVARFFSQFLPTTGDTKRPTAWHDYGFPQGLYFRDYWSMYKRNGIAKAGVMRHIEKTWTSPPEVRTDVEAKELNDWEKGFADMAKRTQLWNALRGADKRNRVGRYAGVVLLFADNKRLQEPVDRVPGGWNGLARVIPVYESQLEPISWNNDQRSPDYGQPTMYLFNETAVGDKSTTDPGRSVEIHPSRVHIWAEDADDGSIYGTPALEAGYNALVTMEKISGAGGEGFWKIARAAMSMNIDKDANLNNLARLLGTDVEGVADKIEGVMKEFTSGADKSLLLQGMEAKPIDMNMPSPKEFFAVALQEFAASLPVPLPILMGHQTGERASGEDANEYDSIITTRRSMFVTPQIEGLVEHLMSVGVVPPTDEFTVVWEDLSAPSLGEQLDSATKMATINKAAAGSGIPAPYSADEIREVTGHDPMEDELDLEAERRADEQDAIDDAEADAAAAQESGQGGARQAPGEEE